VKCIKKIYLSFDFCFSGLKKQKSQNNFLVGNHCSEEAPLLSTGWDVKSVCRGQMKSIS